jgi:hypothetical protein
MPYRRIPTRRRPYYSQDRLPTSGSGVNFANEIDFPEAERIPLPTEEEQIPLPGGELAGERKKRSFLDLLPFRIGIEELIILGLIFVLFKEGIDDDILILLLFYILFTYFLYAVHKYDINIMKSYYIRR